MQNSGIVGFSYDYTRSSYDRIELNKGDVQRRMLLVVEDGMSLAEKQALAGLGSSERAMILRNWSWLPGKGNPGSGMWIRNQDRRFQIGAPFHLRAEITLL